MRKSVCCRVVVVWRVHLCYDDVNHKSYVLMGERQKNALPRAALFVVICKGRAYDM